MATWFQTQLLNPENGFKKIRKSGLLLNFKGTVSIIASDPSCPITALSDQL